MRSDWALNQDGARRHRIQTFDVQLQFLPGPSGCRGELDQGEARILYGKRRVQILLKREASRIR